MIQMIGIRKNTEVQIREKLSILPENLEGILKKLLNIGREAVMVSTCNRTEIYFTADQHDQDTLEAVFDVLQWDKAYLEHVFYFNQKEAAKHLLEVCCGFHSKILGEDQIVSQIKKAFELAKRHNTAGKYLSRLFQTAITCSKEFRNSSRLQDIPISSSSIVIREAKKRNLKRYMIIGYGEVGKLTAKYILDSDYEKLYIAVRNPASVDICGDKIEVINFADKADFYGDVECIISCTSAPDIVVKKQELPLKDFLIFDLAVPRDVEETIADISNVELYDIDKVSALHDETYMKRKNIMDRNKEIINDSLEDYMQWLKIDDLAPEFKKMMASANHVSSKRIRSFHNKMQAKDPKYLAEVMIKSTSNNYLNRAIEVLKEEHMQGRGEECLEIIRKIFQLED